MCRILALMALLSPVAALVGAADAEEPESSPEFSIVGTVERATLSLSILPRPGYRLLADAPVLVRLDGSRVELSRHLYRREDAVDPRAEAPRFEIPFRVTTGTSGARVEAELTFYICKAARCRPIVTRYGTSL